jgi:hypothetical protein
MVPSLGIEDAHTRCINAISHGIYMRQTPRSGPVEVCFILLNLEYDSVSVHSARIRNVVESETSESKESIAIETGYIVHWC